eukprot:NODE_77_length_23806_cov_0.393892.p2 type:complete len:313 gc:universal NODE_77_length_23806_cov_0.393892:16572-15634(-)
MEKTISKSAPVNALSKSKSSIKKPKSPASKTVHIQEDLLEEAAIEAKLESSQKPQKEIKKEEQKNCKKHELTEHPPTPTFVQKLLKSTNDTSNIRHFNFLYVFGLPLDFSYADLFQCLEKYFDFSSEKFNPNHIKNFISCFTFNKIIKAHEIIFKAPPKQMKSYYQTFNNGFAKLKQIDSKLAIYCAQRYSYGKKMNTRADSDKLIKMEIKRLDYSQMHKYLRKELVTSPEYSFDKYLTEERGIRVFIRKITLSKIDHEMNNNDMLTQFNTFIQSILSQINKKKTKINLQIKVTKKTNSIMTVLNHSSPHCP